MAPCADKNAYRVTLHSFLAAYVGLDRWHLQIVDLSHSTPYAETLVIKMTMKVLNSLF